MQGRTGWRIAEPCILVALFVTLSLLLPLAFPCTPTHCIIVQGETTPRCPPGESDHMQCAPLQPARYLACCWSALCTGNAWRLSSGPHVHVPMQQFNPLATCRRVVEDSLELFTCKPTAGDSEFPDAPGNSSAQGSYNELATLMTVTGAASILICPAVFPVRLTAAVQQHSMRRS